MSKSMKRSIALIIAYSPLFLFGFTYVYLPDPQLIDKEKLREYGFQVEVHEDEAWRFNCNHEKAKDGSKDFIELVLYAPDMFKDAFYMRTYFEYVRGGKASLSVPVEDRHLDDNSHYSIVCLRKKDLGKVRYRVMYGNVLDPTDPGRVYPVNEYYITELKAFLK